jgi:hypothetical protein
MALSTVPGEEARTMVGPHSATAGYAGPPAGQGLLHLQSLCKVYVKL